MNDWIDLEDELPPPDVPVWVYDPREPMVLLATLEEPYPGESLIWMNCYGEVRFDFERDAWRADSASEDDIRPSHWHLLPQLPLDICQNN